MVYRHWETAHPDCLGSLWWVKQAFHTWREKKDIEAGEKGEYFRARRANRKALPKTIKHHNGKIGEWRGEVFVPLPNQEQYLPKG